jgi:hypothetical protein
MFGLQSCASRFISEGDGQFDYHEKRMQGKIR